MLHKLTLVMLITTALLLPRSVLPTPLSIMTQTDIAKDEIQIVQASLLGSILANLLLILGMCFLFGGLRFREQVYEAPFGS